VCIRNPPSPPLSKGVRGIFQVSLRAKRFGILGPLWYETLLASLAGESNLKFMFNGFPEEIAGNGLTVRELLDRTREDAPAVIVEINGRFVYRRDFETTTISEGDRVEFIHPSFGG
jgi:sulfur carrier protein